MRIWITLAVMALLVFGAARRADALTVGMVWPADGERVNDSLLVAAEITSAYDITATATVGTETLPLGYGNVIWVRAACPTQMAT